MASSREKCNLQEQHCFLFIFTLLKTALFICSSQHGGWQLWHGFRSHTQNKSVTSQFQPTGRRLNSELAVDSSWPEAIYLYFRNKNNKKMQHPCREIYMSQGWGTTTWAVPCETLGILWLHKRGWPLSPVAWGIVPKAGKLWSWALKYVHLFPLFY